MSTTEIISLHRLEGLLKIHNFSSTLIKKTIPSFYIVESENSKYVKPNFTQEVGSIKEGKMPKIILISAAGATGKSELTQYLSAKLRTPVFDLSKHDPVASNSLSGLFYETLGPEGLANYIQELNSGNGALIIDALDEGHLKTTVEGFNSFLDGIIDICQETTISTPFILLGRTQVIEHSWFYFEEKKIDCSLLRLQPFTTSQACDFIDKQMGETNYDKQYQEVRNYIIQSVEGFFNQTSEINKKDYQSFIGYAPVLQSIVILLKKTNNFKALHEDLIAKNDRGINLIISIVEYILTRDKEEKIRPIIQTTLLKNRSEIFTQQVNQSAYSIEEQCTRILLSQISAKPDIQLTDDPIFNQQYEEKIAEWLKEHPFIQNGEIQNAVFECYIVAKLMNNSKYTQQVLEYMNKKYKDAFMLFFIFEKLSKDRIILPAFLPYLYSSIKSLDDKANYSSLHLEGAQVEENSPIECEVDFIIHPNQKDIYSFILSFDKNIDLVLRSAISYIYINAPINIILNGKRMELCGPVVLACSKLTINTPEFVIENSTNSDGILLESTTFTIDYSSGQVPILINHINEENKFVILSDERPPFPFGEFFSNSESLSKLDGSIMDKYLRLRKIIMLLRSHSKGSMAKLKDKIEHKRVLKNETGEKVLALLIKNKVLYSEGHLYHLDQEAAHQHLGVTYLDLKRKVINAKIIDFLNKMRLLT